MLRLAPALLWAAFIWRLSSQPALLPPLFPFVDKIAHLVEYAIFGLLLAGAVPGGVAAAGRRLLALGMAYGGLDECHQYFVPGRAAEMSDVIADGLGVALGLWLASKMEARQ